MPFQAEENDSPGGNPSALAEEVYGVEGLRRDVQFAIIHDEPFITIIFENGLFWGTVVDVTLEKLDRAIVIAGRYNLKIDRIRCNHLDLDLYLTEVNVPV